MSEIQVPAEVQPEVDPIQTVCDCQCPSLSGRSSLDFAIGRHPDGGLHLRIVGNSGGGMFCDEWAAGSAIDAVVLGATALTSRSFDVLHPGRSINTAGFVLATLKHLGLIRANSENTRHHEHVPTETFEKVAMAAINPGSATKKPKTTKAKPKDAA
jgi:hypothetical protein